MKTDPVSQALGAQLRARRKALHLKTVEVAKHVGCHRITLYGWERGLRTAHMSLFHAAKFYELYELDLVTILRDLI